MYHNPQNARGDKRGQLTEGAYPIETKRKGNERKGGCWTQPSINLHKKAWAFEGASEGDKYLG